MDEFEWLRFFLLVVNSLSLVCGLLLVLTYLRFKRDFPHLGVLCFAVSAWFLSLALLIGPMAGIVRLKSNPVLCHAQGFLIQLFGAMTVAYYLGIVCTLFVIVWFEDLLGQRQATRVVYKVQHVVAPLFGLITSICALALNKISDRGMWCWISHEPFYLEMAFFYAPMGVFSFVALLLWVAVLVLMHRRKISFSSLRRHLVMAVVFFVLFSVMFAHRLYNVLAKHDLFALQLLHLIALSGVGIWLFIIFGVSRHNIALWRHPSRSAYNPVN